MNGAKELVGVFCRRASAEALRKPVASAIVSSEWAVTADAQPEPKHVYRARGGAK